MDHLLSKEKECISKKTNCFGLGDILFGFEGSVWIPQDRSLKTEQHEEDITEKV